jgi:hypothetical protein
MLPHLEALRSLFPCVVVLNRGVPDDGIVSLVIYDGGTHYRACEFLVFFPEKAYN